MKQGIRDCALEQMERKPDKATVIFDGSCPICTDAVQWISWEDGGDTFEMVPSQSESAMSKFPEVDQEACMNAMHLVLPDDTVLVGEKALPVILTRLPRYHFVAPLFKLLGGGMLSWIFYRWFANRRYWIAGLLSHLMRGKKKTI